MGACSDLEAILAIRLAVTPVLMAAALRTRRPALTARELQIWIAVAPVLLTSAMALSVMATGMLDSPYVQGLLLVACGYPFVPQPYRRGVATGVYATLVFPTLYLGWAFTEGAGQGLPVAGVERTVSHKDWGQVARGVLQVDACAKS